jgi:hypothetical protein
MDLFPEFAKAFFSEVIDDFTALHQRRPNDHDARFDGALFNTLSVSGRKRERED